MIRAVLVLHAALTGQMVQEPGHNLDFPSASLCATYGRMLAEDYERGHRLPLGAVRVACLAPETVSFRDEAWGGDR